jgi:hypothetical protein
MASASAGNIACMTLAGGFDRADAHVFVEQRRPYRRGFASCAVGEQNENSSSARSLFDWLTQKQPVLSRTLFPP